MSTEPKNFARVICHRGITDDLNGCGPVELTPAEYDYQMGRPNRGWICPRCGDSASFDDEFFEEHSS